MVLDLVHFMLWAVIGALTAWAASNRVMRPGLEEGFLVDFFVGGFSAVFFTFGLRAITGQGMPQTLDIESLIIAFGFAALALGALRFTRKPLGTASA